MYIQNNIYKDPKYKWADIVQFDRARDGGYAGSYGWSKIGYGNVSGSNRPMGVRLVRGGSVLENSTAWTDESNNGTYLQFNNLTQSGDKLQAKFDPSKIERFWYRYAGISQILFDTSNCPKLKEISLRRNYGLSHGDLDLSGSPLLEVFEISNNSSINSVVFHPSAPIELVYVSGTSMSGTVIDSIMAQCVAGNVYNGTFINSVSNTQAGCDDAETLIARGWSISNYTGCADTEAPNVGDLTINGYPDAETMDVSWTASSDNVGVTEHKVRYKEFGATNWITWITYPNGSSGSTSITGLTGGTSYHVQLVATDAAGNYAEDKAVVGETPAYSTFEHSLGKSPSGDQTACAAKTSAPATYYMDNSNFNVADKIYIDAMGNTYASAGWFSDGSLSRYWNGTGFTSSTFCM
jgi:hypothetical protein